MFQDNLLARRPPWLLDALAAVHRHQALLPHQVAALVRDDPVSVAAQLERLREDGLLGSVRVAPFRGRTDAGDAYLLTAAGLLALQRAGRAPPGRLPRRALAPHALAHDLERNELGVALERLDAQGHLTLQRWVTARAPLGFAAHVPDHGTLKRIPLVADALAVVDRKGRADSLLVEIDMGSVSFVRMRTKYQGYLSWWQGGGPAQRFGLRSLRVLTLAPTAARMKRLLDAAAQAAAGGLGFLWFGTLDAVSAERPEALLDAVWVRADRPGERSALWA